MPKFIGRLVNLGIGRETTRGGGATPAFWIPHTSFTFDDKCDIVESNESLGVIEDVSESYVVSKTAEGSLEGEVRDKSFGLLLYALLGNVSSSLKEGTVYDHTFTLQQSNQHQSLAFTVNDPIGDLMFKLVMLNNLELSVEVGQIVGYKANFVSLASVTTTAPSFSYSVENKFTCNHLTLKLANSIAELDTASQTKIKKLNLKFSKNLLKNQLLGSMSPDDILNQEFSVEGSLVLDYEDRDIKTYMLNNTYKAMRIDLLNDEKTIGNSSHPELKIDLSRCYFREWDVDRDLSKIVTQEIKFKALRDLASNYASVYNIVLTNEHSSY